MEFRITKAKGFVEKGQAAQAAVDQLTGGEDGGSNGQILAPASLDLAVVKPRFEEYLERVNLFEKSAQALEVKDQETLAQAVNLAGGAKKLAKAVINRKLEITKDAREFTSKVNAFVDQKFIDPLESAAKIASEKELNFLRLEEMKRREKEKLAQDAAAKLQKDINRDAKRKGIEPIKVEAPVVSEVGTKTRTEAGITGYTVKVWDFKILDESEVPRIYCSPDPEKIHEAVKNGVRNPAIPGVDIFEKEERRHRG